MVTSELTISIGQCSEAGVKPINEDACGIHIPDDGLLTTKGVAIAIADGVSSSEAAKQASNICIQGFLSDYYSTPESWTVKSAGQKVLAALNHWLYGQNQSLFGHSSGMATTLSVLIIKSTTAYIFHVGDSRIYRLRDNDIECLTLDHRIHTRDNNSYLTRAMGIEAHIEIDFQSFAVEKNDIFILTSDGVHDFINKNNIRTELQHDSTPDFASRCIVKAALQHNSDDNVTCQVIRIDKLPEQDKNALYQQLTELPFPPPLSPGMLIDGYRIIRELHASKHSELFFVVHEQTSEQAVLKAPSVNYEDDAAYIERFLHEEWIAKRLDNPHILKIHPHKQKRQFLYYLTEYIDGQTLRQWMNDQDQPSLAEVRKIIEQISTGLRAFHRREMVHQDLKPENIIIDTFGTVKIIDFGSTKITGVDEIANPLDHSGVLGTKNYSAPEYLRGWEGSNRSDIYSLGVIMYEMLIKSLPYGSKELNRTKKKPIYINARSKNQTIPYWLDATLEKAVQHDPEKRYESLSEFIYDLSHPNPKFNTMHQKPLIERKPIAFWQGLSFLLVVVNIILFYILSTK